MPQFKPGESKTATATFQNPKSAGFDYQAKLCMGTGWTEMASASFHLNAVESKAVEFPVTMPATQGTYPVYFKVTCGGVLIGTFAATEDVVIAAPVLVLTAKNMPYPLWDGSITDLTTGQVQSWPVTNIAQRIQLNALSGTLIFFQYHDTDFTTGETGAGPFLIQLPATAGEYQWDGAAKKLSGIAALELPKTDNKQRIRGTLVSQEYGPAWIGQTIQTIYRATVNVTRSIGFSGKVNVGQYFLGRSIMVIVSPPPLCSDRYNLALNNGDLVEFDCAFQYGWQPAAPWLTAFLATFMRQQRQYPDSAYVFQASGNIITGTWNLRLTVTGAVSPFRVVIVGYGVGESSPGSGFITEYYYEATLAQGPVTNAVFPLGMAWTGWKVLAHPDPAAEFRPNYWRTDNWQQVLEILP